MFPRHLLVVSTPTDSAILPSAQIESIVNSLNLAVVGKLLDGWEMLVLPSSTELQPTSLQYGECEDRVHEGRGPMFEISKFANSELTKTRFLEQTIQGTLRLICSKGTVFSPSTVSELLISVNESSDILSTQSYPVNLGIGKQPVTSVLLASERSNKAFIELIESNSLEFPISSIITQLSSKYFFNSSLVPTAKSFDTEYVFEKTLL